GRGVAAFEDGHYSAAMAVLAGNVRLRRESVTDVGHISEIDRGAADDLYRKVAQLLDCRRTCIQVDVVLKLADLSSARRQDQVLLVQSAGNILGRQPFGLEQGGLEVDHNLTLLSAIRERNRGSGNSD